VSHNIVGDDTLARVEIGDAAGSHRMRSVEVRAHSADTTNMYPHAQNERMRICTCAYEYIVNKSELAAHVQCINTSAAASISKRKEGM
jgi:hypothetical protein